MDARIRSNHLRREDSERLFGLVEDALPQVFPALSIYVLHDGDCLLDAAWGWLDPETETQPVGSDSYFDLASVTKVFVETAFLTLVSAGKVGLDDPLATVIPEFAASGPRPVAGIQDPHTREHLPLDDALQGMTVDPGAVTFRHLLTHTSGLPPWRDVFNAAGSPPPPPDEDDPLPQAERWQRGLRAICDYAFAGPVGETVRYSDLGLLLLGESVARLHGARLDLALRDRVLRPLDLHSVGYNPLQNAILREQIAPTEYDSLWRQRRVWGEVHDENACGVGGIAGHAGLFAQAGDVAALGQAWLQADSRLGITADLMAEALREQADGQFRFGLGWMLKATDESPAGNLYSESAFGHTGFTGTSLWIDPQRQLVTAILSNRVYVGREKPGIAAFRRAMHDCIAQGVDAR